MIGSNRAFSLIETLMAIGLLATGFLLFFRLFHVALNYTTAIDRRVLAVGIAHRQLAKLRGWAHSRAGSNYGFDDWSSNLDRTFPDEEHSEFSVRIQSEPHQLTSPSSQIQVGGSHVMTQSAQKVQVTVSWTGGQTTLVSLVADPTRVLRPTSPLVLQGATPTLSRNETANFSVKAFDTDDRPIADLVFRWNTAPMNGNGTIIAPTEGSSSTFKNAYGLEQDVYTGGQCRVMARAVYRGQAGQVLSDPITLNP